MTLTQSRIQDTPARPARQDTARTTPEQEEQARIVAEAQAQRLRDLWSESRDAARSAARGSPAFARVADLAAAYAAMAVRAGQRTKARAVMGDALVTLRAACVADRTDPARHLALARTLELAAAYEVAGGDARAAFDALRAAISTVGAFAPTLRDRAADPLVRMSIASALVRPISTAARMIDDRDQRLMAHLQIWQEAKGWARASRGAADHAAAIELAVVAAFELAVEQHADSASECLERLDEIRSHVRSLEKARGDDAVTRIHRAAAARLGADCWKRLGDPAEAERLLQEAESHLAAAAAMPGCDPRELESQRTALARQRTG